MDVNKTIRELMWAAELGQRGYAQELALALLGWLRRGGFPPIGYTIGQATRIATEALIPGRDMA